MDLAPSWQQAKPMALTFKLAEGPVDKQDLGAGNRHELAGAAGLLIGRQHLAKSRVAGALQRGIREKSASVDAIWGEQASCSSSDTFLERMKFGQ